MKLRAAIFGMALLAGFNVLKAQGSVAAKGVGPRMFVEPSSTTVYLGKVRLTVDPLCHKGQFYLGAYEIKVVPYSFKNEKGQLRMEISDESYQKLTEGIAVEFTGKAINDKNGTEKVVLGKTMPATGDHGVATFSIVTDHGLMVFNTAYRLGD